MSSVQKVSIVEDRNEKHSPGESRSEKQEVKDEQLPPPAAAAAPPKSPLVEGSQSGSSRGNSPIPVPLIVPRYQKKTRTKNSMEITDSTSSEENTFSPGELLRQRSLEALNIKHGCATYDEHVRFHAYALYRHGHRGIVTQSIGYSSDGDLVLHRQDIAEKVHDMVSKRVHSEVGGAVCLDPSAKRPLTDTEELSGRKINASKLKKYPGVKCPKNKKIRNRLHNDHFANPFAKEIYDKVVNDQDSDSDEGEAPARPTFEFTSSFHDEFVHQEEESQLKSLEKKGISPVIKPLPIENDPNSADVRFQLLSNKLRDEMKHALRSEILTTLIDELEEKFLRFIEDCANAADEGAEAPGPLQIGGLDGYGRLICHGVAAFYKLISQSEDAADGSRVIGVAMPKKIVVPPNSTLLQLLKSRGQKVKGGSSPGLQSSGVGAVMPSFSLDDGGSMARQNTRKKKKPTKKK